jgi:hypothetical protein
VTIETVVGPVITSLAGALFLRRGLSERDKGVRMQHWANVAGVVSAAEVVRKRETSPQVDDYAVTTRYRPAITFEYVVDGRTFRGQRVSVIEWEASPRGVADQVVAEYPVGRKVVVYYDPLNPSDAVLDRTHAVGAPVLAIAIGVVLIVAGLVWLWRVAG